MLNDKLQDADKIAKDVMHKEKDLLQNITSLPVRPILESSQVFCKHLPAGNTTVFGFGGEAQMTFVHEALGKMALATCGGKDNKVLITMSLYLLNSS